MIPAWQFVLQLLNEQQLQLRANLQLLLLALLEYHDDVVNFLLDINCLYHQFLTLLLRSADIVRLFLGFLGELQLRLRLNWR